MSFSNEGIRNKKTLKTPLRKELPVINPILVSVFSNTSQLDFGFFLLLFAALVLFSTNQSGEMIYLS